MALLYRKRWGIELLFKKMKQNFQLHFFYGENEMAIHTPNTVYIDSSTVIRCCKRKPAQKRHFALWQH
ncbi:MAG TPA: transposase [Paludibacteraceae bacterium]|nr:transposase [Paludibacteraceae bacterium]